MLGISRALAYQLVRGGELPSIKLGRRVVVPRAALLRLVVVSPLRARARPTVERGVASREIDPIRSAAIPTRRPHRSRP
jgi:excisionase family DNA binding protein